MVYIFSHLEKIELMLKMKNMIYFTYTKLTTKSLNNNEKETVFDKFIMLGSVI